MTIRNKDEFLQHIEMIKAENGYKSPIAFGICRVDRGQKDPQKILQATYFSVNWQENFGSAAVLMDACRRAGYAIDPDRSEVVVTVTQEVIDEAFRACGVWVDEAVGDAHRNVQAFKRMAEYAEENGIGNTFRLVFLYSDEAPQSVEAVYLKLYALSLGKVPLRGVNLSGAFGQLHNVAWAGNRPYELDWLRENEIELKVTGNYPDITGVDKFPRYLQHVIPTENTRILDSSKVRMGAQLHAGTTVMPGASYINFNAGTTGAVMVEGRISSSAIVGAGSDVGGGASILGVLSGTNGNPVSIGKNTLLGANSTTGIPLGDGCIVDAGLAVLEGTKVAVAKVEVEKIREVNPGWGPKADQAFFKGVELSGLNGIHFRQNSTTGQLVAMRSRRQVELNAELH